MDKPRLQFLFIIQLEGLDTLLAVGTFLPGILTNLIAAYVYIFIREEFEHFAPDIFAEFEHLVFTRTEGRSEELPPADGGKA